MQNSCRISCGSTRLMNGEAFDLQSIPTETQIVHKYKSQFDIILMDVEMKFMDGHVRSRRNPQD